MMRKNLLDIILIVLMGIYSQGCGDEKRESDQAFEVVVLDPVAIEKSNEMHIYVHYMPWFETPETTQNHVWGIHWTMADKNPDHLDSDGLPDIASHFNPLIGPYASGDESVIECQLLLMKYAGIDGVLIDWYGTYPVNDYPLIKENTEALVRKIGETGLKFAIVYEDRTVSEVLASDAETGPVSVVKNDLDFLERNYFPREEYIHIDGKPLLMVFGPITILSEADWSAAFADLNRKPFFLTLWNHAEAAGIHANGEYAWVYRDNSHLENFYSNRSALLNFAMGAAYPGFIDFYEEGGWEQNIGWEIPHNNGNTLSETLNMAQHAGVHYLQIITWNDYGEGTMIEPTHEFGFSYLEQIKQFAQVEVPFVFDQIIQLYDLRKRFRNNNPEQQKLDQAFYYFVAMQPDRAIEILNEVRLDPNQ